MCEDDRGFCSAISHHGRAYEVRLHHRRVGLISTLYRGARNFFPDDGDACSSKLSHRGAALAIAHHGRAC